jgi:hypothetical protein
MMTSRIEAGQVSAGTLETGCHPTWSNESNGLFFLGKSWSQKTKKISKASKNEWLSWLMFRIQAPGMGLGMGMPMTGVPMPGPGREALKAPAWLSH